MAIDTSLVDKLISDFKSLTQKDAISPETLGSLIQRVTDLIKSCSSESELNSLMKSINSLRIVCDSVSSDIDELQSFKVKATEDISSISSSTAQCADSIVEINRKNLELESAIDNIELGEAKPKIYAYAKAGSLYVANSKFYLDKKLIPYVFRFTSKRNKLTYYEDEFGVGDPKTTRGEITKGWQVLGGHPKNISVTENGLVMFNTAPHEFWHNCPSDEFSSSVNFLIGASGEGPLTRVPWGRKTVYMSKDKKNLVLRRFKFAIGFGYPKSSWREKMLPSMLASNLATFSVSFDPRAATFSFGK